MKYTDEEVLEVANLIVRNDLSVREAEGVTSIPYITIWWQIHHRLNKLDYKLYRKTKQTLERHIWNFKEYRGFIRKMEDEFMNTLRVELDEQDSKLVNNMTIERIKSLFATTGLGYEINNGVITHIVKEI
jgi:hypothetical protein